MVTQGMLIGIEDVFPEEKRTFEELLQGIPSKSLTRIFAYIGEIINESESQIANEKAWKFLLNNQDKNIKERVAKSVAEFTREGKISLSSVNLLHVPSLLNLIQFAIIYDKKDPSYLDTNSEQELNILKAILKSNHEIMESQRPKKTYGYEQRYLPLSQSIVQFDFFEPKDFLIATAKSIMFLEFAANDLIFKILLDHFLDGLNLKSWKDYFLKTLNCIYAQHEFLYKGIFFGSINMSTAGQEEKEYLASFCFSGPYDQDFTRNQLLDMKLLRMYPVVRIDEDIFVFVNFSFFIEKLSDALFFDLEKQKSKLTESEIFEIKKIIPKISIKNFFGSIKSYYSFEFKEKILFRKCINIIFSKNNIIKKFDDRTLTDAYIRDGNIIYLFEFKDYLFKSEIKQSADIRKIQQYLVELFGEKKGIRQLVNSIQEIRANFYKFPFEIEQPNKLTKLVICPFIIFTDISFNAATIENFLVDIFDNEIKKRKLSKSFHHIYKPMILDIDSFLKHSERLNSRLFEFVLFHRKCEQNRRKRKPPTVNNFINKEIGTYFDLKHFFNGSSLKEETWIMKAVQAAFDSEGDKKI